MENLDYTEIDKTYRKKILRYLTRLLGEEDAKDLTQDVFIKIYHSLNSFRGDSNLSTWIYKIATNAAFDKIKSPHFRTGLKVISIHDADSSNENSSCSSNTFQKVCSLHPDDYYIREEMNKCILNFIERLSYDYKSIIILCEIEGFTNQEAADITGYSLENVKIRLHRAKKKLKSIFEKDCIFYRNKENELACDLRSAMEELKLTS